MPHLLSDIAQLWVFWLAAAGIVLAVVTMVWHSREASRRFDGWCETLHVHPDLIHSHTDGDHAHVHTETGERVPVRG